MTVTVDSAVSGVADTLPARGPLVCTPDAPRRADLASQLHRHSAEDVGGAVAKQGRCQLEMDEVIDTRAPILTQDLQHCLSVTNPPCAFGPANIVTKRRWGRLSLEAQNCERGSQHQRQISR